MKNSIKTAKQIERHMKGVANHWRIEILLFINKNDKATLEEITDGLKMNIKTASEHTRRLVQAGLISKAYFGRQVEHTPSPYGKIFISFITSFQHS